MIKVIAISSLIMTGTLSGAYDLYQHFMPTPIATAVVAEKPEKAVGGQRENKIGGQAAFLVPENLNNKQAKLLEIAATIAKEEGISPAVAQGVLLQETNAGGVAKYKVANEGPEAYFGPMQIKLAATKDVLRQSPYLYAKYAFHTKSDDEIKANLILNEEFNVRIGVKYLRMLKESYKFSGRELMNAYNRGPGGVKSVDNDTFHYAIGAEKKLASWKDR